MRTAFAGLLAVGGLAAGCAEPPSSPAAATTTSAATPTSGASAAPAPSPDDRPRAWDPRDVDDLPAAPDDVAPLLPAVIEPPFSATPLAEAPVRAAVLSVIRRRTVLVLAADGSWRSVPVPERYAQASLSSRGTRLLFTTRNDVEVWDLTTGERRTIPFPGGLVPWDFTRSKWVDDTSFLVDDRRGGWLVDIDTCSARRVPYPRESAWAVDEDGAVVESSSYEEPDTFTDWADEGRSRTMEESGRLERLVATSGTIVGTTYDGGLFRVVVADRSDLRPKAVLPLVDHDANYSTWALGPVAAQSDGIVIIWVAVVGKDDGWRLVAWDPRTGDLSLVSRSDAEPTDAVTYAVDLLR